MKNSQLVLGWLYPTLMSTYGDRGNIIVLQKIAKDNDINLNIIPIDQTLNHKPETMNSIDLIFMGGGEDLQQEVVAKDLLSKKGEILAQKIEDETPGLFICGAYQFLGNYYKDAYGTKIKGLGIFDMYTQNHTDKPRLTGNIVIKPLDSHFSTLNFPTRHSYAQALADGQLSTPFLVGFENHGGRTYLKNPEQAFAKIVVGFGNNGKDKTEGIYYKNAIGTYLHGPILPSNPELAADLLEKAYAKKYQATIKLKVEGDFSKKAKMVTLKRLKTQY